MLLFAAGGEASALEERLAARRQRVAAQLQVIAEERARLTRQGFLSPLAVAAFRRGELRLEAELQWHDEFVRQIAPMSPAGPPVRALRTPRTGQQDSR